MKSLNANLLATYQSETITICGCFKVVRLDGIEFYLTDHPEDVVYNGDAYIAASGFYRTAISQNANLSVNNLDLQGLFDSDGIKKIDLLGGLFDGAYLEYFELDYKHPEYGRNLIDIGYLGRVSIQEDFFITEFRSLTEYLSQQIGHKYGRYCRNLLGDAKCGIILNPNEWVATTIVNEGDWVKPTIYNNYIYKVTTGGTTDASEPIWNTVIGETTTETGGVVYETFDSHIKPASVTLVNTTRRNFTCSSLTQPDGWFQYGEVKFITGNNAGYSFNVKYFASGQIILIRETPFDIAVTDLIEITVGCNHILKMPDGTYSGDCKIKFYNGKRFRGEPELPGDNKLLAGV